MAVVTRIRAHLRTLVLVAVAAMLAFASPVQSAYALTGDFGPARVTPGNTEASALELAKQCLRLYMALPKVNGGATEAQVRVASDACRKAIDMSGLSSGDFWAKYRPLLDASESTPVTAPTSTLEELIRECIARTTRLSKAGILTNNEVVDDTRAICNRAIELSGLTPDQFWTKYGEKPVSRPAETSPLFMVNVCVQLAAELTADSTQEQAKVAGEACRKALAAR